MSHTKMTLEIDYGDEGSGGIHRHEIARDSNELSADDVAQMAKSLLLAAGFLPATVEEIFNVE